jgi:hypothetical protein
MNSSDREAVDSSKISENFSRSPGPKHKKPSITKLTAEDSSKMRIEPIPSLAKEDLPTRDPRESPVRIFNANDFIKSEPKKLDPESSSKLISDSQINSQEMTADKPNVLPKDFAKLLFDDENSSESFYSSSDDDVSSRRRRRSKKKRDKRNSRHIKGRTLVTETAGYCRTAKLDRGLAPTPLSRKIMEKKNTAGNITSEQEVKKEFYRELTRSSPLTAHEVDKSPRGSGLQRTRTNTQETMPAKDKSITTSQELLAPRDPGEQPNVHSQFFYQNLVWK